jgi:hypothetical protein
LLLLLYFGCKTDQRSIPFGYLHIGWFAALQSSSMFRQVFIAKEVDGVGDKGLEDITTVDVHTLLEAFVNVSLRSACFTDEPFSREKAGIQVLGQISSRARDF